MDNGGGGGMGWGLGGQTFLLPHKSASFLLGKEREKQKRLIAKLGKSLPRSRSLYVTLQIKLLFRFMIT